MSLRQLVDHGCQPRSVVRDELRRDDEHRWRIRCARESGVERVGQPTRERRVDPKSRLRDIADDHLNLGPRRHVAHDVRLTVPGERARDRADEADALERRAAGQAALDQRVQPVLGVEGAGAGRSFRRALHDDDATGVHTRAIGGVHRGYAQRAQQHAAAELEHTLGQLVSVVGARGPPRSS